ncbi:hypothetical protein BLA29_005739 [Euroglyphus maynei]|uniref:Uncharacterized protein n=1 Tax=Euroglyphus maynei TaxID=6958 RepID=A0A1Y3AVM0_EURMA|nr:hypothetical protein BLA29_005739 [Euroglyphus maynei]
MANPHTSFRFERNSSYTGSTNITFILQVINHDILESIRTIPDDYRQYLPCHPDVPMILFVGLVLKNDQTFPCNK